MSVFIASIGYGVVTAAVLAIASVGFSLQFAVTNVLNLAFTAVMIVSAYVDYVLNENGVSVWVALVPAVAAGAALSVLLNQFVYAPFQHRRASPIALVIVSLGMTLVIEFATQAVAGPTNVSYTMGQGATLGVGSFQLTAVQYVIIAISVVLMVAAHLLLAYTRLGKAMRATAANRDLARSCGIRTARVVTITWCLSGAMCGLAGVVFAADSGTFGATSADLFLVLILAAVFLGGPGEAYGAMLGAVVIGLATEVSASVIQPDYKYVVAFLALLAILALRPTGILGARA